MCWRRRFSRDVAPSASETAAAAAANTPKARPRSRRRARGRSGNSVVNRRAARPGDVVTVDFTLTPEDGYVPHPLFDTSGSSVSFVLGWGNYLPGLHDLIEGMRPGESVRGASIDAGWGRRDPALVAEISKARLSSASAALKVGDELELAGGAVRAIVVRETETCFVVDANPPLAGSSYSCDLTVLDVSAPPETRVREQRASDEDAPALLVETSDEEEEEDEEDKMTESVDDRGGADVGDDGYEAHFRAAAFAVGCFWGGELAFMREPGVAGTRVGYTQGSAPSPTYQQVCEGSTGHREAVLVVYDPKAVSYERLLEIASERMDVNATSSEGGKAITMSNLFDEPDELESEQYRHGVYFYTGEQRRAAHRFLRKKGTEEQAGATLAVELRPAATFHLAEEKHQNYLLKGGQSAKKGAKEPIRCFG